MAMAAAASPRALCTSALTGNHASAGRPLSAHSACRMTRAHDSRSLTGPGPDERRGQEAISPRTGATMPESPDRVAGEPVILSTCYVVERSRLNGAGIPSPGYLTVNSGLTFLWFQLGSINRPSDVLE
jgi:hypothetical protein